jgi:hypothetical protein
VERLTDQVSNKMNLSLYQYLPKVAFLIDDHANLTTKFEKKREDDKKEKNKVDDRSDQML